MEINQNVRKTGNLGGDNGTINQLDRHRSVLKTINLSGNAIGLWRTAKTCIH